MIKLLSILKEIIQTTQEYDEIVNHLKDQGGQLLGTGDYGAAYQIKDRAYKVTTDSEEIEDAQRIKGNNTKYFVHIYDVTYYNDKLALITMDVLDPFLGTEDQIPIDQIEREAEELGIYPDLEGPQGSIKMQNVMQDRKGNIKIIDV